MTAAMISAVYALDYIFVSFIFCTYLILFAWIYINKNWMQTWLILYSSIILWPLNWTK